MGKLISNNTRIKRQQLKSTSVKVTHKVRVLTQKDIDENRSSAYSFIL